MRSDTNTAAARKPALSHPGSRAAAAAAALLVLSLLTGVTASPLLPLLVAAVIAVVRYVEWRAALLVPPSAALVLISVAAARGHLGIGAVVAAVAVLLAAFPGMLWRREARRTADRLTKLDDIMAQARRDRGRGAPSPADELADLELAMASIAARIGARNVLLWDVDGHRGTARPHAGSAGRPHLTLHLSGDPLGWAWDNGMRLRLDTAPRWAEPGTSVVVDRLRRHEDHGDLVTYVFKPGRMPADDLPFEEAAVYLRGIIAMQDARASEAASESRMNTLLSGVRSMPGELDIDTLAPDLCQTATDLVGGTGAAIGLWSGEHGTILAVTGDDGGPRPGDVFGPPASELALAVRAEAMLVRQADRWKLGQTHVAHPHERWKARPRALAALPLRGSAGTIGVLAVWTSEAAALEPAALNLLHALSPYAALHLEHARVFGSLRESAERDPLTQLRNRRAFDEIFAGEAMRFERYGRPISLLMLDLDHFKAVNDRLGHEAGDEVLRRVARTVESCIRDVDAAARLGGEEFVALMPETSLAAALDAGERIRKAIAAATIEWRGTSIPVTVSVGVSSAPELVATPDSLIGSADAALYQAKAEGRNRVMAAEMERRRPV
jgi:diguanylate cyclase (GGDEF)-like protein